MQSYIFTYGTLRREFNNTFARRLQQQAVWCGRASISGRLYDLGIYPGAVFDPDSTNLVWGDIWQVPHFEAVIALLDHYEGIGEAQPEYERIVVPATFANGNVCHCWFYNCTAIVSSVAVIPHGDYWQWCTENKKDDAT